MNISTDKHCVCGAPLDCLTLTKHMHECKLIHSKFDPIMQGLFYIGSRADIKDVEVLMVIAEYIMIEAEKLRVHLSKNPSVPKQEECKISFKPKPNYQPEEPEIIPQKLLNEEEIKFEETGGDTMKCVFCGRNVSYTEIIFPSLCADSICKSCLVQKATEYIPKTGVVLCVCGKQIMRADIKQVLDPAKLDELENACIGSITDQMVECPNCKQKFIIDEGKVDYNVYDDKGVKLNKESAIHYAFNRIRCTKCNKDFCKKCKVSPYHAGMTCEKKEHMKTAKKCRFCKEEIKSDSIKCVCKKEECLKFMARSCDKLLKCGHTCYGIQLNRMQKR